jgi:dolichyl-phosphate-mannose--protein O-mannosyl transferase
MGVAGDVAVGAAALGCVTAVGLASRFHRLAEPPTPVFDEYHVGRFVNWFAEGQDSFDVHPPLLKVLTYHTAAALGYRGRSDCSYGAGDPFVADHVIPMEVCSLAGMRALSAVSGALLAPTLLLSARALGVSWASAAVGATLLLCDNLFFSLSRVHMLDAPCTLLVAWTVLCGIWAQRISLGRGAASPAAAVLLLLNGLCYGLALSAKFAMAFPTVAWLGLHNAATLRSHALSAAAAAAAAVRQPPASDEAAAAAAAAGMV